jgi:hypothetical protein
MFTTDAYLGLPTDILGTEYIVLGYKNTSATRSDGSIAEVVGSQFVIVAPQNGTQVTITPSVTTGSRPAGVPYTIALNQGQAYQLSNIGPTGSDLSGSIITANQPIAVFGGHRCTFIPGGFFACDHVVEQLPPTQTWGKAFVTMPLATRLNGDTFRILASTNGTNLNINGSIVATLNRGELHEQIIDGPAHITATEPVLVAQYSNSEDYDGVISDPFMMLIPPFEQFLGSYTISTPASGFDQNFINIVAPNAAVGQITLDGTAIASGDFVAIGSSGFSGAQVPIALGSHHLESNFPFGAFVYGFDEFDSYGYPGGASLAPVVNVTFLTLTPKTATNPIQAEQCFIATVTDQNNNPIEGLRVDFEATGVNSAAGFALTQANGAAQFCYTGLATGDDTVTASSGELSDTAIATWTPLVDLAIEKLPNVNHLVAPGGVVEFTVNVSNNGPESVTLTSLVDAPYGDLTDAGNTSISNSTCAVGGTIAANDSYSCTFRVNINGQPGDYSDAVTATAQNVHGTPGSATGSATVKIVANSSITVIKQATPADGKSFDFTVTGQPNFKLKDGEQRRLDNLISGVYSITEIIPHEWVLLSVLCQGASSHPISNTNNILVGAAVNLESGQHVACTFTNNRPNAATFDKIEAKVEAGQIEIRWTTLTEADTVGFNVMRNLPVFGGFEPVNETLILAQGNSFSGADYSFVDDEVIGGVMHTYYIQEIELNGIIDHNQEAWQVVLATPPDKAAIGGVTPLYLPVLLK